MKFSYEVSRYKLIYVFGAPDDAHKGLLKIGDTTISTDLPAKKLLPNCKELNRAAHERIRDYMNNAGVPYKLLHTELAVDAENKTFRDYAVHDVLKHSGIKNHPHGKIGKEWFRVDLKTAILAIAAVKSGEKSLLGIKPHEIPEEIIFRPEQETAINKTVKYFLRGEKTFLWNAKMRFGKTLCALEVVKQMNFAKTIIVTHRPVVDSGWFGDFKKIFGENGQFIYGEKGSDFKSLLATKKNFVYFASIQDLRGSKTVGGKHDKNQDVFGEKWDFVIVDEAHEGTQTALGDKVIKALVKKSTKFLALSGTPFNLIADYMEENTFTWDYVDEQREKLLWDKKHFGDSNPYEDLPRMNIYTYDLGELLEKKFSGDDDVIFSFSEFFRTGENERFIHENDVKNFLNLLVSQDNNNYPFANEKFCNMFRHTLWRVPGVREAKALSLLLQNHRVFCNFGIANVAGDGDEDIPYTDALKLVQETIAENDYSITISCGKLTTGVTVPEWTAVLYLAGNYLTSATNYLQTIFRVQTPCNKNGVSKQNCYVFDFAPDRALKMVTEFVKISDRAGKATASDRKNLDTLLNFCPVIAVEGSRMKKLDANKLLQQIKRAQAERIVQNGFDDSNLYNDTLRDLTKIDLELFKKLKGFVGAKKSSGTLEINRNNVTDTKNGKKSTKTTLTDEQKEINRKNQLKRDAILILRQVSIRMPLLIYGADIDFDKDFTIEMFLDKNIVDDDSWAEFMPAGVTREFFKGFMQYYDPENFINAGKRVRKIAKDADSLNPTDRVKKIAELFATFKNPDKETVLTPWRVVNLHLSEVFGGFDFFDTNHEEILDSPRQIPTEIFRPDKKILEINSKTGLYPLYVAYSIFRAEFDKNGGNPLEIWDKIVAENVFVICKTPMAKTITRRTLLGYRDGIINAHCFDDLINTLKNKPKQFLKRVTSKNFWNKGAGFMFFDAVVGNPPYQNATSTGNFAAPVYHEFIKIAYGGRLANHASLIHPARWLFNAGAAPKDFIDKFLADEHVKVVRYEPDAKNFFPTSEIKGGIAVTEYDSTKNFGAIGIFIPFDELKSIYQKVCVENPNFKPFSDIVFGRTNYRLSEKFISEHPDAPFIERRNDFLKSNAFSYAADYFFDEKPDDGHDYCQIFGILGGKRVFKWIRRDYIVPSDENLNFDTWKVFVPESNSAGAIGEVLSTPLVGSPLVGSPLVGCTQTFITVGAFDTESEARACIAYIKSKFCRVMLGILKVTQHNPPQTWAKVPLQDFTGDEIDWSGDVDGQLYRKYGLSDAEIAFIESKVKEMS